MAYYKFKQTPQEIQAILDRVPKNTKAIADIEEVINQMAGGGGEGGGSVIIHVDDVLDSESTNPVENRVIALALERLNAAVFPFSIKTFTGGGTFELGTAQTVALSWTYAYNDITSQQLNSDILPLAMRSIAFENVTATTTYTLRVVYGGQTYTKSVTATFKLKKYYGVSSKLTSELTDADILAMSSAWADGYTMGEVTLNCSGGKYIYYCIPTSKAPSSGLPDFRVGGFSNSDWEVNTKIIAKNNRVEGYTIYRLRNLQTGSAIRLQVL